MKKFALGIVLFTISLISFSQKITVTETQKTVQGSARPGYLTTVLLEKKFVEKVVKESVKDFGKTDKEGQTYFIAEAKVPTISSEPIKVYFILESAGASGTTIWMAFDLGNAWVNGGHAKNMDAMNLVKDIAKKCYTTSYQEDIKAAEDALNDASKDHDKTIKKGENLQGDLQKNAEKKIDLEKAIEENKQQKVDLENQVEQNKKDQSAATEKVEKMKKALELQKQKLNNIQ